MEQADELSPEVRQQLLEVLEEMEGMLRAIHPLADSRGRSDYWGDIVRDMLTLRRRVEFGPLGDDFAAFMHDLSSQYDLFVETVLPPLDEH